MSAPKLVYGRRGVIDRAQPESGEHQGGGPTLGVVDQRLDLLHPELEVTMCDEQLPRLCRAERKLPGPQLGERATGAEPSETQCRVHPCDEHHACIGRQCEKAYDRGQAVLVGNRVQVVENDGHLTFERCDAVDQRVDSVLEGASGPMQQFQRAPPEPRAGASTAVAR